MSDYQPLKYYFGKELARELSGRICEVHPKFPVKEFIRRVAAEVEGLELKARVAAITRTLHDLLPENYQESLDILCDSLGPELGEDQGMFNEGYYLMPVAHFVEIYGLEEFGPSMAAIEEITKRHTGEYAIRPFLSRSPKRTMKVIHKWARDPSPHVRRLASEGIRPRLPWATRIESLIEDPKPILEVLDVLKDDPSAFVRKSVANNLNDICKDHPKLVLELVEKWMQGESERTAWIVRHGLRNLIKNGDPAAMELLGFRPGLAVRVRLRLASFEVRAGSTLEFEVSLLNEEPHEEQVIVDYVIDFVRPGGRASSKVFKLKTLAIAAGERIQLEKKHSFRLVKTRLYAGKHRLSIQVNGRIVRHKDFQLAT